MSRGRPVPQQRARAASLLKAAEDALADAIGWVSPQDALEVCARYTEVRELRLRAERESTDPDATITLTAIERPTARTA